MKLLSNNTISPATGPWSSNIVLIGKKDGSTRFCLDFRQLNKITVPINFKLPLVSDLLSSLGSAKWFTTLDLTSAYHSIEIRECDKMKTQFCSPFGSYQFNRMPFGLKGAAQYYSFFMQSMMSNLSWQCVMTYIDDCIVYSKTFEQHLEDIAEDRGPWCQGQGKKMPSCTKGGTFPRPHRLNRWDIL